MLLRTRFKHCLVLSFLILAMCSCSVSDSLEKTSEKADYLTKKADDVAAIAAILLRDARQAGALQLRTNALKDMQLTAKNIEQKVLEGVKYFQAFEFQLWENILSDDEVKRQNLLAIGAEEFLLTFKSLINGKRKTPDPLSSDGDMQSLLALSATADQLNLTQIESSLRNNFKPISMLDILLSSLQMLDVADTSLEVPIYVKKVLLYEDEVSYLFDLRYNIYTAIVVDRIFRPTEMDLVGKLKLLLSTRFVVDLANFNAVQIDEIATNYISAALSAKKSMSDLGRSVSLNQSLLKILRKVEFKNDPEAKPAKIAATERLKTALAILTLN